MQVVVVGLGHLGTVTVANLLRDGHQVIGIDTNATICDQVARGLSPHREPDVAALIANGHAVGRLSARAAIGDAIEGDMAFVCVGTRGLADGALDLSDVKLAAQRIGAAIRRRLPGLPPMLLVFRCTMPPGAMRHTVLPALTTAAGEAPGTRYELVYNPSFSREGSAVADDLAPARIVIGERQPGGAQALRDLLSRIDVPVFATSFEVAELIKFADNAFHALKVAFANEIGRLAVQSGVAPSELFDLFKADTKLNISGAYLQPGGAFGGPCLPKDVRALAARMRDAGVAAPVVSHIIESNALHLQFLADEIGRRALPPARVLLVGLAFKPGVDDMRESPLVQLAELLLDRGYQLSIYDPDVTRDGPGGNAAPPSPRVAATVRSELDAETAWDLVVLGKTAPDVVRRLGRHPLFAIDRL